MTTLQMNAELLHNMSIIAEDENLLRRAAKYMRKLVAEKQSDETAMTRNEFFTRIDEAKKQIERGECTRFSSREEMEKWLNTL